MNTDTVQNSLLLISHHHHHHHHRLYSPGSTLASSLIPQKTQNMTIIVLIRRMPYTKIFHRSYDITGRWNIQCFALQGGGRYGYHFYEILKQYFQSGHQNTCNHSCQAQN